MSVEQPKPTAEVTPWMMTAACRVIHGKQDHSDWIGARPPHLPEQACEWAAMIIAEEATEVRRASLLEAARLALRMRLCKWGRKCDRVEWVECAAAEEKAKAIAKAIRALADAGEEER